MTVIPAWVWRGGVALRAVVVGLSLGLFFGALGWAESGSPAPLVALAVLGPLVFGIPIARRSARFWPGAEQLVGADRVALVRATRRGQLIDEPRLVPAVIAYVEGLRRAHEQARPYRWVIPVVAVLSLALAVIDSLFGSLGLALVSWLWVAIVVAELLWWPRRQARILSNADRVHTLAGQVSPGD